MPNYPVSGFSFELRKVIPMRFYSKVILLSLLCLLLLSCSNPLVNVMTNGTQNPEQYQDLIQKNKEGARKIIVALEQYKKKYGSYPDTLIDLVPEYFQEVPPSPVGNAGYSYSGGDTYKLTFIVFKYFRQEYSCTYWEHSTLGRIWECGYYVVRYD